MKRRNGIQLDGVGLCIDSRWILRDVSWSIPRGRIGVILGPNGSGKSTLARIIAGHTWPTEGSVTLLGQQFGDTNLLELRKSIRLVQPAGPYDVAGHLTTRQVVQTGYFASVDLYDRPTRAMAGESDRMLRMVGLSAVIDHPYRTLSSGEKVRCLIARALVHKPGILILDEPTSGLDLLGREQVLATIHSLVRTAGQAPAIVLITHHIEDVGPDVHSVLLLDKGRIAASGPRAVVLRSDILSHVYRCPLKIRMAQGRFYAHVHPRAWLQIRNRIP